MLTGTCSPLLGFGRFSIKFFIGSICPTLSILMMNLRTEFDLVTMDHGSSRTSRAIFIGLAVSACLTFTIGIAVDLVPKFLGVISSSAEC